MFSLRVAEEPHGERTIDSPTGDQLQVAGMVERARLLLDRIVAPNGQPDEAHDAVQELRQIVVDLQRIHPPQTFQRN